MKENRKHRIDSIAGKLQGGNGNPNGRAYQAQGSKGNKTICVMFMKGQCQKEPNCQYPHTYGMEGVLAGVPIEIVKKKNKKGNGKGKDAKGKGKGKGGKKFKKYRWFL